MPPPIFRGAVKGDVMHLLDPNVTIGKMRHLNANNDVLQLIAQFVWSVEPGARDAGRYGMCVRHPLSTHSDRLLLRYEPGQSGW